MARFIHMGLSFKKKPPPNDELEKLFNKALDWLRYDWHCWIIYTSTDIEIWRDRILKVPGLKASNSFFLCAFDAKSYAGYMHQWVWDWLKKDRPK